MRVWTEDQGTEQEYRKALLEHDLQRELGGGQQGLRTHDGIERRRHAARDDAGDGEPSQGRERVEGCWPA